MICFSRLGNLGQLGNQLFQVAVTLAAAEHFSTNAKFPAWRYARFFRGSFDQSLDKQEISNTYYESTARFQPIPGLPDLDLFGFFQSLRYFKNSEALIRRSFSFVDDLLPLHWMGSSFDCSIHVRRGDYLQRRHEFVPLHLDYYESAIGHMKQQGCQTFLVFSDDIDWCKINFKGAFTFVEDLTDIQALCLLSQCKNHIIANSTFSWWGSWLSEGPDRLVIAPQTWYAFRKSLRKDDRYQYCPSWHLISNEVNLCDQVASLMTSQDKRHFIQSYLDRKKWIEEEYEANIKRHAGA